MERQRGPKVADAITGSTTIWGAITEIRTAWQASRAIVPLVGAGISADSGIPIVRSIVRYFGKFQQLLEYQAYIARSDYLESPPLDDQVLKTLQHYRFKYASEPWVYVKDFGWPDRFQLNQDLLDFIRDNQKTGKYPASVADAAQLGIQVALANSNPSGHWHFSKLKEDVLFRVLTLIHKQSAKQLIETYLEALKGKRPEAARDAVVAQLASKLNVQKDDPGLTALKQILHRFQSHNGSSVSFDVAGDWKRLIQYFTNYQGDYADALITRLCAGRGPSLGHQFLAYLCRLVGSKLILTYNFDDLIERSFHSQGVYPRVFGMEEGVRLPPETLVRDDVSVLKLHGSNHALLLDERVDHPLSDGYKQRFNDLVGANPLLLVIGCSGNDMRVRDLVQHVLQRNASPSIVWLHFEDTAPTFLREISERFAHDSTHHPRVVTSRTNNPGADLVHIYTTLSGRHPAAGTIPYPVFISRPSPIPGTGFDADDLGPSFWEQAEDANAKGVILSTLKGPNSKSTFVDLEEGKVPRSSASETLIKASNRWLRNGYQVIWVDLESVTTIAGVAGSILDQCRAYDIHLAASVLPGKDSSAAVDNAVRRVAHALQRSRYFVVLDGLETYPWGPLTHHGYTHFNADQVLESIRHIMQFFHKLAGSEIGESRIWLGVDRPKLRNDPFAEEKLLTSEQLHLETRRPQEPAGQQETVSHAPTRLSPIWKELDAPLVDAKVLGLENRHDDDANNGGWPLWEFEPMRDAIKNVARRNELRWQKDKQLTALSSFILFHLSCFRRTRPLATLRHLMGLFFGRRDTTRLLDELFTSLSIQDERLGIIRMSGGGVWFNRTTRDFVYSENSKHASTKRIGEFLSKGGAESPTKMLVMQLFLLTTTHQRISRSYHSRAFAQSRDSFAFLEYTYHRVSSIRYLAKLIAVVERMKRKRHSWPWVQKAFISCGDYLALALGSAKNTPEFQELLARMEFDSDQGGAVGKLLCSSPQLTNDISAQDVADDLRRRHTWEIRCLYRGWVRTEQHLREQVPAQQLSAWCERLLNDEFKWRLNRVVIGYEKDEPLCWEVDSTSHNTIINKEAEPWIQEFSQFIKHFLIKINIDRRNYDDAIEAISRNLPSQGAPTEKMSTAREKLRDIHYLLDRAVCYLRASHRDDDAMRKAGDDSRGKSIADLKRAKKELSALSKYGDNPRDVLSNMVNSIERKGKGRPEIVNPAANWEVLTNWAQREGAAVSEDYEEAILRYHQILAEWYLCNSSVFAPGLSLKPHNRQPLLAGLEKAKAAVDVGLHASRAQVSYGGRTPRSALVERSADGTMYPVYRSAFYTLFGRLDWQREWLQHSEEFLAAPEETSTSDSRFEAAYRDFEMARGGLGSGNRLLLALNELYFVEATLVHARVRMFRAGEIAKALEAKDPSQRSSDEQRLESLERGVFAKHEAARQALQRAKNELLAGRRNVTWWRFYYEMSAQYQAERMLAAFAAMRRRNVANVSEQSQERSAKVPLDQGQRARMLPAHITRLRRGYNAIRTAFDYDSTGGSAGSHWLTRAWVEMTLAAFAIGCEALYRFAPNNYKPEQTSQFVFEHVKWFNQRERLLATSAFAVPGDQRSDPTREPLVFERLFADPSVPVWVEAITKIAEFPETESTEELRFTRIDNIRIWASKVTLAIS